MFLGQYERSLDDRCRVAIPVELRNGLGPGAILTRSFDNCLCIYPATRWESLALAISDLPDVRPDVRDLARSLFGSAVPCDFDRQGRVVIPAFLREHAGLTGEAVVVGVNSHVEIWDREGWRQRQERFEREGARLAQALTGSAM
jgi:MraZ protein